MHPGQLPSFHPRGSMLLLAVALSSLAAPAATAQGIEAKLSGRVTAGSSYRLEAADPLLLSAANASAASLFGLANAANADDSNLNFRRNDATSTVIKSIVDLNLTAGDYSALVRVKAWYDYALSHQPRNWGNAPNRYTAGAPLSDAGFPALSRFEGAALADAYVAARYQFDGMQMLLRAGRQTIAWGGRVSFAGGLQSLYALDLPASRRPGMVPQEVRLPVPALFGRLQVNPALAVEAYLQTAARPNVLDGCGTFFSLSDYVVDGCDKLFVGAPVGNDRVRLAAGAYISRTANPWASGQREFGIGATFKSAALETEFGLYHARMNSSAQTPGGIKSTRVGLPLIAGDPDGRNVRYFIEFPQGIALTALTFARKLERGAVYGELSYRPNMPVQLAAGDLLGAFISNTAGSLVRADIAALAPGAAYHSYDRFKTTQAQLGLLREWTVAGGTPLNGMAEVVWKHVAALPDPARRRYGRADVFGLGPVAGVCNVNSPSAVKQCSSDGYVTPNAWAYRLRLDARLANVLPALLLTPSVTFTNDVKGWSYDGQINEKRQTLNLAVRAEYRQRYLAELVFAPNWGGDYNALSDRDLLSVAVGVKF